MKGRNIIPAALLLASAILAPTTVNAQEKPSKKAEQITLSTRGEIGKELSGAESPEKLPETMYITAKSTRVRKAPKTSAKEVFKLFSGMEIHPIEIKKVNEQSWVKIRVQGEDYWIFEDDLDEEKAPEPKERVKGYKLVIDKEDRTITLLKADNGSWSEEKVYPMGIGGSGDTSPKQVEGDGLTPTGKYYIANINPRSNFGEHPDTGDPIPSLQIGYPNRFDAWRGLQDGVIDTRRYKEIARAIGKKGLPRQRRDLGTYIMIHGGGASDWTIGCIAVDNIDMLELSRLIKLGTPVEIK